MFKIKEYLITAGVFILAILGIYSAGKSKGKSNEKAKQTDKLVKSAREKNSSRNRANSDSKYLYRLFNKHSGNR